MANVAATCQVCSSPKPLVRKKVYRLNSTIALVAWILFLAPGLLMLLGGGITCATTAGAVASEAGTLHEPTVAALQSAGVPPEYFASAATFDSVSDAEVAALPADQQQAFRLARAQRVGQLAGAGIGGAVAGGFSGGIVFGGLFLTLVGLLLTMRKLVLACPNCKATVAAG